MATSNSLSAAAPTQTRTANLAVQCRSAELVPSSFNEADNTIEIVWTAGARVRRYDWYSDTPYEEELVVTPEAVDMTRFEAGTVQVLDSHRVYGGVESIMGIAISARIEDGKGYAKIRLSARPEMAGIVADIKAGIIRAISFGYSVQKYEITRAIDRTDGVNMPLYSAVRWQPHELSFVTVPADPDASTRNHPGNSTGQPCEFAYRSNSTTFQPTKEASMSTADNQSGAGGAQTDQTQRAAPAAPAPAPTPAAAPATDAAADATQRAVDITELCERHGLSRLSTELIRSGKSMDQIRSQVLDELARNDAASGGHTNARIVVVGSEKETRMAGIQEALLHRVDARAALTDNGRQYRGMSLLELGRDLLESNGVNTRGMDRLRLAQEILHFRSGMFTTSDFANLFANVANKRLRAAYDENPGTYQMWARRAPNAPDFKNISVAQLSGAPDLLQTNEHGEFKYGSMKDGAESYNVLTYGRIVSLSRQSLVNDDLRGFDRLVSAFGNSARRLENRTVYAQLTANAALADGSALFHAANHGNLGTGAGSALQFSSLTTGRAAMRKQKGLASEELNIVPAYLIAPAALEQTAYQLTSSNYVPAKQSDVNEFRTGGRTALEPVIEPILDAISATAWYLASNNGQIDTVEYCYLDGAEGAVIEEQVGFEIDGMQLKCRLDFAAKAIDHRGLYRADGA
jgi:phage head maturation protease